MSSLRIDSLRLVWLEAFVQVAETENISEAARELSCDQSTVTRHIQALEKWLGKKLVTPGVMTDAENPGVNVSLTGDGLAFRELAASIIEKLKGSRTEAARRAELLDRMEGMISKMRTDLESKRPSQTVLSVEDKVEVQTRTLAALRLIEAVTVHEGIYGYFWRFFANYESELKRERHKAKNFRKRSTEKIGST